MQERINKLQNLYNSIGMFTESEEVVYYITEQDVLKEAICSMYIIKNSDSKKADTAEKIIELLNTFLER